MFLAQTKISIIYDAANRLTDYEKKKDGTTLLNQKNRYNDGSAGKARLALGIE